MFNMQRLSYFILVLGLAFVALSCRQSPDTTQDEVTTLTPYTADDWKDANIYEVNLRQYTEEGTIEAFMEHLPRLQEMGVEILWFMPIHPISVKNRKAKGDLMVHDIEDEEERKKYLGSYYAVSDFRAVNPEFGTMQEFKTMVDSIHAKGMRILLDWVPNHTGWDHVWIEEHPEYYTQDEEGNIIDPINPETGESWGWTDVADLNYDNQNMRDAMIEDMKYWIAEANIDGYRCDVAHGVPSDFWQKCIQALNDVKPVFMLAEAEIPRQLNEDGFNMNYGWEFHHIMNEIAKGEKNATHIDEWLDSADARYSKGFQMHFTSNHDENSWAGTEMERMGEGHQTFAVLAATFDGMPLIYSGQEEPLTRMLKFFEKDPIGFKEFKYHDFYKKLLTLKKENQALWNGAYGGELQKIETSNDEAVYAFRREKNGDKVVVILNLTDQPQDVTFKGDAYAGKYTNVFTDGPAELIANDKQVLAPWQFYVFSNK